MTAHEVYSPRNRAERVIAAGRLFLAGFLAVAIHLDPTEPQPYAPLVQQLALWYLAYAAGITVLVWRRRSTSAPLSIATHAFDMALFSLFIHFTEATGSPFFVYLIFATLAGAIRWHGTGALLTGAAALAAYITIETGDAALAGAGQFEMNRFLARCTQLAIVTGLVAYLATYHHRLEREIAALAAWPRQLPTIEAEAAQEVFTYAARVLRVRRLVVAWEEGDEPAVRIATAIDGQIELTRERPDAFGTIVAPALEPSSFLCTAAGAPRPRVLYRLQGGFAMWRGEPLDPRFRERFGIKTVVAVRLAAGDVRGWLFALDRRRLSADDLLLGDIVGRLVAGALELNTVLGQLREAAAAEERLRLARELHDGVLQALTAASLQAQRARTLAQSDPAEAERRIKKLEETILAEQQTLRLAIADLKPAAMKQPEMVDCVRRVREAAARVASQWEIQVDVDASPDLPPVPRHTAHEIVRMVQEAVVNAVRHGGAREVSLSVSESAGALRLGVLYEGRGFAGFSGRHDLASLTAMRAGPRTLKERVATLGGSLVIESRPDGARLEITVPM